LAAVSFFKRTERKDPAPAPKPSGPDAATGVVASSKVLPRFLSALAQLDGPALLDVGPVVGPNVAFFGDELACKLFVEDLYADVESHARRNAREETGAAIVSRLTRAPASVDAILCWDLFDYLDRPSGKLVAATLVSILKPGGLLYAFFSGSAGQMSHYTRFVVESRTELRLKTVPGSPCARQAYVIRDIDKMFAGLTVVESVLLKSQSRETLFRKPA